MVIRDNINSPLQEEEEKVPGLFSLFLLQLYWFPTSLTFTLILSVVLPSQVDQDSKLSVCIVLDRSHNS